MYSYTLLTVRDCKTASVSRRPRRQAYIRSYSSLLRLFLIAQRALRHYHVPQQSASYLSRQNAIHLRYRSPLGPRARAQVWNRLHTMPLLSYVDDVEGEVHTSHQRILAHQDKRRRSTKRVYLPTTHCARSLGSRSREVRMSGEMSSRDWLKVCYTSQESCRWEKCQRRGDHRWTGA